ncbi:MAG: hypothetical protein OHK0015_27250 [Chloroflexi bacterium OHK40]
MIGVVLWVAAILCALLIVAAIAVPLAALAWWAGWISAPGVAAPLVNSEPPRPGPFLVYLSGVGDISGEYSTRYEDAMLDALVERVPGLQVVTDVFAYSWANVGLTSEGDLGWFWAWLNAVRLNKRSPLRKVGKLINLRNVLHIAVSADNRYGPIYNYGVAEMIIQGLLRHGYRLGSGTPVTLLGYSGGAQIAVGTAGYIQATLRTPVQVISLGGIFNSNSSLERISSLVHLYGSRDRGQRLGQLIFPARWPLFPATHWGRALAVGKVSFHCLGPMVHSGRGSYLDDNERLEDGRSFMAATADAVAEHVLHLGPGAPAGVVAPTGQGRA